MSEKTLRKNKVGKLALVLLLLSFNVLAEPTVKRISEIDLKEKIAASFKTQYPDADLDGAALYGAYSSYEKAIYLTERVDLNTLEGQSTWHHEYKHYLDDVQGVKFECQNERERSAYDFENLFRWDNDLPLIPESFIKHISKC